MIYSRIAGTGSYLPKKILTNADLEKMVETTDEWIVERTGIKQRHIASEEESVPAMGASAAKQALTAANLTPADIDLIIVATATSGKIFPSAACYIQQLLGIQSTCPAFDIGAACSGFSYGLAAADKFIKSGAHKTVLVVGAEAVSRGVDWTDRTTCVLFGDGAGAVVLTASDQPGILSTHLHANGQLADILYSTDSPTTMQKEPLPPPHIKMAGQELFKYAVTELGNIVIETLAANNLSADAIDWLVPHQANIRIISATAKKLNMPMERVVVTVDVHGNTSAASIPLALDTAVRDGRIKRGQTLLLESFGAGLTWGSALIVF